MFVASSSRIIFTLQGPRRRREIKGLEKLFEDVVTEKFLNLWKETEM